MDCIDQLSADGPVEGLAGNGLICFAELERAVSRTTDEQMNLLFGVSARQAKVVACLAHQPFMTRTKLAHQQRYDLASISPLVSPLVAEGIAMKSRRHDHRSWCISLTMRGSQMVVNIGAALKTIDDRSMRALANDEQYFFVALLKRLLTNAEPQSVAVAEDVASQLAGVAFLRHMR
ncbi:MarR family winged helix-turn-helix transcriptional regulator [Paraburkholderia hospita]|uniref:MarR family winged helix-turn-helix transcriptional regulator n=1 Tax=Paraburkholderia hospita TaxID=169430 RepID=UPI000DEFEAB3|nr:MarR family winged helix-turn-helix transcriptional regulator [Paraburkholderia hospita]AXF05865.1 MarR family transcriptional regulator [Paraburkholderia hospita]